MHQDHGKSSFLFVGFGQHVSNVCLSDSKLCSRDHIPHGRCSPVGFHTPLRTIYLFYLSFTDKITLTYYNCRIEKVRLDRKDGILKVSGTVFCIAGASVITLFKGPTIYSPSPSLNSVRAASPVLQSLGDANGKSWSLGCLFLIGHCLSWSAWLVLQAPVLKKYPARLSFTSYQCFFGVLQFLVLAAFMERDINAWFIHSGAELFSVFYAVSDKYKLTNLPRISTSVGTYHLMILCYNAGCGRIWDSICCTDMVHRQRWPGFRGLVSTRSNPSRCSYGFCRFRRRVLFGRVHN